MGTFEEALKMNLNTTLTENGAVANESTNSYLLDFFSLGGALRDMSKVKAMELFKRSLSESELMTLKAMFYFRDIRGGQGQRNAFRDQIKYLAEAKFDRFVPFIPFIPDYGRWDDLYALFDTPYEDYALFYIKATLQTDEYNVDKGNLDKVTLLAKWLKSENASSPETKRLARKTRKYLGYSSKEYRKLLSKMRNALDIVERKMSAHRWFEIDYQKVPSKAMMQYRRAFGLKDGKRFDEYIEKVKEGKAKLNSSVLYPYEIVSKLLHADIDRDLANEMWKGLPTYTDKHENAIAVVDTSGSMTINNSQPLSCSIALGILLAERCTGSFKNCFISFSERPHLQSIRGNTISQKVAALKTSAWGYNTNIEAVFELILQTALSRNTPQNEMPKRLYIISDMEFDTAMNSRVNETLFRTLRSRYEANGYTMPELIFWNVNARNVQFPMSLDDRGFLNVSGLSHSLFKHLIAGEYSSPEQLMLEILNSPRYNNIA